MSSFDCVKADSVAKVMYSLTDFSASCFIIVYFPYYFLATCVICGILTGKEAVYSELRTEACGSAETGLNVLSSDGFIIDHYSRVRTDFHIAVFNLFFSHVRGSSNLILYTLFCYCFSLRSCCNVGTDIDEIL